METAQERGMTAALSEFVASARYEDLPDSTIENAKLAILDTVACAIAASRFRVGTIMVDHVRDFGGPGQSSAWAGGYTTSAPMAAYVNGHLANALDYDLSLHLDTHALPAALALGEHLQVSGTEFLRSYIPAREVGARLMKALDGGRYDGHGVSHRGWWHVGIVGPIDAALVSASLLGLDEEETARAVGIASHSVGGFRRSLGTMTKSLHSGRSARDGVHSALLAQAGFTGDPEILEAPMGYIAALCPQGEFDYDQVWSGLGSKYELEAPPKVKPFPSCGPSQAQVDSLLELLATTPVDVDQIEKVVVDFHPFSLFRPEASDAIEAGFSTPYVLAATLVDKTFGLDQLEDARVHDTQIRKLMAKFMHEPETPDRRVEIHLQSGERLVAETKARRTLRTWDDISAKFDACVDGQLNSAAAAEFKDGLSKLEQVDDVRKLLAILRTGV